MSRWHTIGTRDHCKQSKQQQAKKTLWFVFNCGWKPKSPAWKQSKTHCEVAVSIFVIWIELPIAIATAGTSGGDRAPVADYHTTSLAALSKFGFLFLEGSIHANFGSHIHSPDKVLALGALFSSWSCDTRLAAQKANFWQPQSTDLHLEKNIPISLKRCRGKNSRGRNTFLNAWEVALVSVESVWLCIFWKKGLLEVKRVTLKKQSPQGHKETFRSKRPELLEIFFTRLQHLPKYLGGGACICGVGVALYFWKRWASRTLSFGSDILVVLGTPGLKFVQKLKESRSLGKVPLRGKVVSDAG